MFICYTFVYILFSSNNYVPHCYVSFYVVSHFIMGVLRVRDTLRLAIYRQRSSSWRGAL
jgi:hypothetical protein